MYNYNYGYLILLLNIKLNVETKIAKFVLPTVYTFCSATNYQSLKLSNTHKDDTGDCGCNYVRFRVAGRLFYNLRFSITGRLFYDLHKELVPKNALLPGCVRQLHRLLQSLTILQILP